MKVLGMWIFMPRWFVCYLFWFVRVPEYKRISRLNLMTSASFQDLEVNKIRKLSATIE